MAPPKGNKYGVGKGRPPINWSDEELHALGKEFVAWSKSDEFKDAVHLDEFAICKKHMFECDWKQIIKRECFRPYYETVRKSMAFNLLRKKEMHDSMGNRYLCFYDRCLHEWEESIKDKDAERKSKENNNFANFAQNLAQMGDFFEKLRAMQSSESKVPEEDRTE